MSTTPPSQPDHEPNHHPDANDRIDRSLTHHTRAALSEIAEGIETMTHSVTALDGAMAEVGASDEPDRMRRAVVAARGALLQLGVSMLAVERGLGRVQGYGTVRNIFEAERGS